MHRILWLPPLGHVLSLVAFLFLVPAVASASASGLPQPSPGGQRVHINSNLSGAALIRLEQRYTITTSTYGTRFYGQRVSLDPAGPACIAPCDTPVDPVGIYFIGGPRITPSRPFMLPISGAVQLDVQAGYRPQHRAGVAMTFVGLGVSALGVSFLIPNIEAGASGSQFGGPRSGLGTVTGSSGSGGPRSGALAFAAAGGVLLGAGVAMLATGIGLWATSGTHLKINGVPWRGRIRPTPQGFVF